MNELLEKGSLVKFRSVHPGGYPKYDGQIAEVLHKKSDMGDPLFPGGSVTVKFQDGHELMVRLDEVTLVEIKPKKIVRKETKISIENFCPSCIEYDSAMDYCFKINANVYYNPNKFFKKCSGKFFVRNSN